MASSIQLLRSTNPQERPFPGNLLEGQPAVNLNTAEPGLFFKASDGSVVKFGPAAITSDGSPPNSAPQGSAGNSVGELWLDKSVDPAVLKVYDGTEWVNAGSGGGGGGGGGGTGSFVRWIYTSAGGETSLSGSSGGVLLDYTPGLEEVYINGVLLTRGVDYSATNGTSITNLDPLGTGDVITVLSMNPLETVQLPGQVTLLRWTILAAAGQTVLSGVDSTSQQLAYTAGLEEVYINGAFLRRGTDYTATNGTTITVSAPLAEDDEVTVLAWTPFVVGSLISDADVAPNAAISSTKLSFIQANPAALKRTVENRLRDEVSVLDFIPESEHAAIKDFSSTYDAADAIQAAIDMQQPLYFPSGRYNITKMLVCNNGGQHIYGSGPWDAVTGGVLITQIDPVNFTDPAAISFPGGRCQVFENIAVHVSGGSSGVGNGSDAILINGAGILRLANLIVKRGVAGIRYTKGNITNWEHILAESNDYGFVIEPVGSADCNGGFISNCRAYNSYEWGWDIRYGTGNLPVMHNYIHATAEGGNNSKGGAGAGIRFRNGRYNTLDLYSESNDGQNFDISSNSGNIITVKNPDNDSQANCGLFNGFNIGVYTGGANVYFDGGFAPDRTSVKNFTASGSLGDLAIKTWYISNSSGGTLGLNLSYASYSPIGFRTQVYKTDNTPGFILNAPSGMTLVGDTGTFGAFPTGIAKLEIIKVDNTTLLCVAS